MMYENPVEFKKIVKKSLRRHYTAIDTLASHGLVFWDYGNAFLLECDRAFHEGEERQSSISTRFKYPSYMQDVMGDIFSLGFGPFRWVCSSGEDEDLLKTDKAAQNCIESILENPNCKLDY